MRLLRRYLAATVAVVVLVSGTGGDAGRVQ